MKARLALIGTLAVATALAPAGQAQIPDDRGGMRGPGGIAALQSDAALHPDNRALRGPGSVGTVAQAASVRPDDRGGVRGPGAFAEPASGAATHPDNRAGARGPGALATEVVQPARERFDWSDAVIGGIGGIGLGLLLTGCLFLLLTQRQRTRIA